MFLLIHATLIGILLATGLAAQDATDAHLQQITDSTNAMVERSPSFSAKWRQICKSERIVVLLPGHLHNGKFGETGLDEAGNIVVRLDVDACRAGGEPLPRVIAHEICHVVDILQQGVSMMNYAKMKRLKGVSYRIRDCEAAAFAFQAKAWGEFIGEGAK